MSSVTPTISIPESEVVALAADLGTKDGACRELAPSGSIRTFRVGNLGIRVDHDQHGSGLHRAQTAMSVLATSVEAPLTGKIVGAGERFFDGRQHPWLAYEWLDGSTLTREQAQERPVELGETMAQLHAARVFDLIHRFDARRPMTLMETFKTISEQLRSWLMAREVDGLSQDLLTLTLSDLLRSMRQYAVIQDHYFLTARRRVLLHGDPRPDVIVGAASGGLRLVNLETAALGDSADDLAMLSLSCALDPDAEATMLEAYQAKLSALGREDRRVLLRFFPRRFLLQLERPVARLAQMLRIKKGEQITAADPVAAIEEMSEETYELLVDTFNGLSAFVGQTRPTTLPEVKAMGRLLAYEELLLAGRTFRLALTGLPYAGKTEVGAAVARRLGHTYLNTSVLARALVVTSELRELLEAEGSASADEPKPSSTATRLRWLFERGLKIEATLEAPFYRAILSDSDVTSHLRHDEIQVAAAALLDDEKVRSALKDELSQRFSLGGLVLEGAYADELVPGRARHFHLLCDPGVRRARLMAHRPDVTTEEEAEELLTRLDEGAERPAPDAVNVDVGARPASAAALDILWDLLPPGRRPPDDEHALTGRAPLYS